MTDLDELERLAKAYISLIARANEIHPRLDSELNNRIHFAECKFDDAATPEIILSLISQLREAGAA